MASPCASAWLTKRSTCACKKRLVPNWRIGNAVKSLDLNESLDHARFGLDPDGKAAGRLVERNAVGDERLGRHESLTHRFEHYGEILGSGVAAAEQRGLALVELGVGEANRVAHDADQDVGSSMGDIVQSRHHRLHVSGRVNHDVEEVAGG